MWRGISLANKCLLLFGGAVVLIVLAALSFSWLRIQAIVEEGQRERSRQLVQGWLYAAREFSRSESAAGDGAGGARGIEIGRVYGLASEPGACTRGRGGGRREQPCRGRRDHPRAADRAQRGCGEADDRIERA